MDATLFADTARVIRVLLVLLAAAACSSGGDSDGGVLNPPAAEEFLTADIDGVPYRASRVASAVTTTGTNSLLIRFFAVQEPMDQAFSFELDFAGGIRQTGTWTLAPATAKQVNTSHLPTPATASCVAWWNSTITITRNDASRIEGSFYIEGECSGAQYPPPDFIARNGRFGICLTTQCEALLWRDTE